MNSDNGEKKNKSISEMIKNPRALKIIIPAAAALLLALTALVIFIIGSTEGETPEGGCDHSIELLSAISPTCTEEGLTEGRYCTVCNKVLSEQKPIAPLGHDWDSWTVSSSPTEISGGEMAKVCKNNGTHRETLGLPILTVMDYEYTAVSSELGRYSYVKDGQTLSFDVEISAWEYNGTGHWMTADGAAAPIEHTFIKVYEKAAGCTEDGVALLRCSECKYTTSEVLNANGHNLTENVVAVAPTCDRAGSESGKCGTCLEYVTIPTPPNGHTPGELRYTDVLCGTAKTGYISCTVCSVTLASFGHSYNETIVNASCTSDGSRTYTCSVCNDSYIERISAYGHAGGEWITARAPDCSAAGSREQYCLVCDLLIASAPIEKKAHTYTSTSDGSKLTYTCTVCADTYTVSGEKHYTVSFSTGGGSLLSPVSAVEGESISLPVPDLAGFKFVGWYREKELKNLFDKDSPVYSDMTLYAGYTKPEEGTKKDTNNIINGVGTDFTFKVKSDVTLTDESLCQYIFIDDLNNSVPKLYIASRENDIYTIGSREYISGMAYAVNITGDISFTETEGESLWFTVEDENHAEIEYKDGVVLIPESLLYISYELDGKLYAVLREDMLNIGDRAVIYGESSIDVLLAFAVVSEDQSGGMFIYEIAEADADEIYNSVDIYYSGNIAVENFRFADGFGEAVVQNFEESPLYRQIENTAVSFASSFRNGNYEYKFNDIKTELSESNELGDNKLKCDLTVSVEFVRVNIATGKEESLFTITLKVATTLSFSGVIEANGTDNFIIDLKINNTLTVDLFVSSSDSDNVKTEMAAFEKMLIEAKGNGEFSQMEPGPDYEPVDIFMGTISVKLYGFDVGINVINCFDFAFSGQIGISASINSEVEFGIRNTPRGGYEEIRGHSFDSTVTFTVMGKLEASDMIKVRAFISLLSIADIYIDGAVGPYFETAGMFTTVLYSSKNESFTVKGGYIDVGIKIEATVGVDVSLEATVHFLAWNWDTKIEFYVKTWTLYSNKISIVKYGVDEIPISFDKDEREKSAEYICGKPLDIGDILGKKVIYQNFSSMKTETKDGACEYYLTENVDGVKLTSDGFLKIEYQGTDKLTLKIKVTCGDVFKLMTLNITFSHTGSSDGKGEIIKPSSCTEEGLAKYTCTSCGKVTENKLDKLPHKESEWIVDAEATCGTPGASHTECTVCHNRVNEKTEPATGDHDFNDNDVCLVCGYEGAAVFTYHVLSDGTCRITGFKDGKDTADVVIPSKINGHAVTELDFWCFKDNLVIESVVIPDSVTVISSLSFSGCTNLKEVTIGKDSNLTTIGSSAFGGCVNLEAFDIPGSVTIIDGAAFNGCIKLTSIIIPAGVTSIGNMAFSDCTSLADVTFADGSSLTNIGDWAFMNNKWLKEISLPDSVTTIGAAAFSGCSKLDSIIIPENVTTIGNGIFHSCSSLKSVSFAGNSKLTSLGADAFYDCEALTEIDIPSGVTSIGENTFYSCDELTRISFADSSDLTSIGDYAFYQCDKLANIVIPDSVTSIGEQAFYGCHSLLTVTIGENVETIGENAFIYCYKLIELFNRSSLEIYAGAETYGYAGIYAENVYNPSEGRSYLDYRDDGYIFYSDDYCTLLVGYTGGESEPILPDSYNGKGYDIFNYAFYNLGYSITSLTIPDCVTSIGDYAFYASTKLESLTLGSSLTSIGVRAFAYCRGFERLVIPASLTKIHDFAFYGCYIAEVYNKSALKISSGSSSFGYVANYAENVYTPVDGESHIVYLDNGYVFYFEEHYNLGERDDYIYLVGYHGDDTDLVLPDSYYGSNYDIWEYAFYDRDDITSVTVSAGVKCIGSEAFYHCSALTKVILGSSVTHIMKNAFEECRNLLEVYNLSSLDLESGDDSYGYIAYYAPYVHSTESEGGGIDICEDGFVFYVLGRGVYLLGYQGDTPILKLPESYHGRSYAVWKYAFYGRDDICSMIIPDGVTAIYDYAFSECDSLRSISIGDGVTAIYDYAFNLCSILSDVTVGNNISHLGAEAFTACKYVEYNEYNNAYYLGNEDNPYAVLVKAKSKSITSCDIHSSTKVIADGAFLECKSLTSIVIPDSVTDIGMGAFIECRKLENVMIGYNVRSIGQYCFYDCWGLDSVTFKNTEGWWVFGDEGGMSIDVTDPIENASYFFVYYDGHDWKRLGE